MNSLKNYLCCGIIAWGMRIIYIPNSSWDMRLILVMNMTPFWILVQYLDEFKMSNMKRKKLHLSCESELKQVSLKNYFYKPNLIEIWD